jgi:hypothetical protein
MPRGSVGRWRIGSIVLAHTNAEDKRHLAELQQALVGDDQTIRHCVNRDPLGLTRQVRDSAPGEKPPFSRPACQEAGPASAGNSTPSLSSRADGSSSGSSPRTRSPTGPSPLRTAVWPTPFLP